MIYTFSKQSEELQIPKMTSRLAFCNGKTQKYYFFSGISSNTLIQHFFYKQFITATTSLSQRYLSVGNCLKLSNLK